MSDDEEYFVKKLRISFEIFWNYTHKLKNFRNFDLLDWISFVNADILPLTYSDPTLYNPFTNSILWISTFGLSKLAKTRISTILTV